MEAAIFGLVGVALGALLSIAKEWWFHDRKNRKDAEYLAIRVACELKWYAARCADVVSDDGLYEGQTNENGYHEIQVRAPIFDPKSFDVDWKSLPAVLMYEVLNFLYRMEVANQSVSAAFQYAATPPDFYEGFEERQLQYACLGIAALDLAAQLRTYVELPAREVGDWDPDKYMKDRKADIEKMRTKRSSEYALTDV